MHPIASRPRSAALVLETNNLRGGAADAARVRASLSRLLSQLSRQSQSLSALDEVVITHDGLPEPELARISAAVNATLRFVKLPPGTDYYAAKNQGFDATRAEVIVFADSDCWPDPGWLEHLLAPFSEPDVLVVSGRTTYRDDLLGQAASAIDFLYFEVGERPRRTRNFYANNVAFRREVFAAHRFQPLPGTYRGHCQVLGMKLGQAGVPIHFVPRARTVHRFPDTLAELAQLRRLRGSDTISVTPHLVRTYFRRASTLAARHPRLMPLGVLAARFGCSLRALGRQDLTPLSPSRKAACAGAVLGITLLDVTGALRRPKALSGDLVQTTLSYHTDTDRLGAPG
jgi:hypothetical protein